MIKNNIVSQGENSDVAAERAVLSAMFAFGYLGYVEVSDIVNTDTFTLDSNQLIWKCADTVFKEHKDAVLDLPTILSAAHSLGLQTFFDKKDELNHLRAIMNFPIEKENVRRLSAKIRRLQIARKYQEILNNTKKSLTELTGDEPISRVIGLVENPIFDFSSLLNDNQQKGPQLIFNDYEEYLQFRMDNPIQQVGLSSGFRIYDEIIGGGFRDGTVSVVGARLKSGKSSHADNVAINLIGNQIPILLCDTEMQSDEHRPRITASLSGVPIKEIETGQCGNDIIKRKKVLEAASLLKDLPYHYLNISGQPFEDTIAEMRRWLHKTVGFGLDGKPKPCLIILDYLKMQTVDPLRGNDLKEYQMLGFMATALVNFAQKYRVPILTYVQLNRDGISREDTDVISGSDRIGWFAANLTILKRQSDEEVVAQHGNKVVYNSKLVPLVARHGPGLEDGDFINYKFDRYICKFTEGPTKNQSESQRSIGQSSEMVNDEVPKF